MRERLFQLLAQEYNAPVEAFKKKEQVLTESALLEGRRKYSREPYFFHMVTTGGNAVITADKVLHPFLKQWMLREQGHWLFERKNLRPLEEELNCHGYELGDTFHMFLPVKSVEPKGNAEVKWFVGKEEIQQFYGDKRFPNAILSEYDPDRPDRIVVCSYENGEITAMAGCSEDAPGWMQIGIDVLPEHRSKGLGTYLVTLLKRRIEEEGNIPFYGTGIANYHSWNIAINSGFCPSWIEIGAVKKN